MTQEDIEVPSPSPVMPASIDEIVPVDAPPATPVHAPPATPVDAPPATNPSAPPPEEPRARSSRDEVPADIDALPPRGTTVRITGLKNNPSYNGHRGIVVGYRSDGAVLVDVPTLKLMAGPIKPGNLQWKEEGGTEAALTYTPKFRKETAGAVKLLVVPPPERRRGEVWDADEGCCRTKICDIAGITLWVKLLTHLVYGVLTFAWLLASTIIAFVLPCFMTWMAISWRAMAHSHLEFLLDICPPPGGAVVSRPFASVEHGGWGMYVSSGHTWRCWFYLLFVNVWFSMVSVIMSSLFLPLAIFPYGSSIATNVATTFASVERGLAQLLLSRFICQYDMYTADMDGGASAVPSPRASVDGHADDVQDAPDVAIKVDVSHRAPSADFEGNAVEEPLLGRTSECRAHARHTVSRHRTWEEESALPKFTSAYLRVFGTAPHLQDISIMPPLEPGRGPRHFVRLADNLGDAERLKVIKAYKQAFSTMYVHITDQLEQERQLGTDYSGLYE